MITLLLADWYDDGDDANDGAMTPIQTKTNAGICLHNELSLVRRLPASW